MGDPTEPLASRDDPAEPDEERLAFEAERYRISQRMGVDLEPYWDDPDQTLFLSPPGADPKDWPNIKLQMAFDEVWRVRRNGPPEEGHEHAPAPPDHDFDR